MDLVALGVSARSKRLLVPYLEDRGIKLFRPVIKRRKRIPRMRKFVTVFTDVFPNLMIHCIDSMPEVDLARRRFGLSGSYLMLGSSICSFTYESIEHLMEVDMTRSEEPEPLVAGDRVKVSLGLLQGITATVVRCRNGYCLIDANAHSRITMPRELLTRI